MIKQETKMVHLQHEVRKLTQENDKLRQQLKVKLGYSSHQPQSKAMATPLISSNKQADPSATKDMFYEMIRDGFIEQMQQMNDEISKT